MSTWQNYMSTMYNNSTDYRNLFTIPVAGTAAETEFWAYAGFFYGATLFDFKGRCGIDTFAERAMNETLLFWKSHPGMLFDRIPSRETVQNFTEWKTQPMKDNPIEEDPVAGKWTFYDPSWVTTNVKHIGFDVFAGYEPEIIKIYPPTGMGKARALLVGMSRTAKDMDLAFDALMTAIARNERLHVNTPERDFGDQGEGVSAYRSTKFTKEYRSQDMSFWYNMLGRMTHPLGFAVDDLWLFEEHSMFAGYPVAQYSSYDDIQDYNPMCLAYNEMMYKNISAATAMHRACQIINFATRPACTSANWNMTIVQNPKTNKVTVQYAFVDNYETICRADLASEALPPQPLKYVIPSTVIGLESYTGRAMFGLSTSGIITEWILMGAMLWYRDSQVVRAAAWAPSMIILAGAVFTLSSVPMRLSIHTELGWFQCFGTIWFFSLGFAMVMGSLAGNTTPGYVFPNFRVMVMISIIILIEAALMLIYQSWVEWDQNFETYVLTDMNLEVMQQSCPKVHFIVVIMIYVYNAIIIAVAATFAFRIRNVPSAYSENVFTTTAIGLISVICVVVVPTLYLINSNEAIFLLVSLGTSVGTLLATYIFAVPKLLMASGYVQFKEPGEAFKSAVISGLRSTLGQSRDRNFTSGPSTSNIRKDEAKGMGSLDTVAGPSHLEEHRRSSNMETLGRYQVKGSIPEMIPEGKGWNGESEDGDPT
ncbi:hypothetical protein HDV00_009597 [Rhizophlyctis rosea]|nr:hypothetical protein HDV00_009597 [Rhizophlyctis rosea]